MFVIITKLTFNVNIVLLSMIAIAETYINTYLHDAPLTHRYWITPTILVGGNILNQEDWEHLRRDFKINAVINLEVPESNHGIACENLWEDYINDNGANSAFTPERVASILRFAKRHINWPIYVHCAVGRSRSTHTTYAILRHCLKMTPKEARTQIEEALPTPTHHFGFNLHTASYTASIEAALDSM